MKEEESTMRVIRSPEFFKHHIINTDDVLEYGIEKAAILGNLDKCQDLSRSDLHEAFPYIEKTKFHILLQELLEAGALRYTQSKEAQEEALKTLYDSERVDRVE